MHDWPINFLEDGETEEGLKSGLMLKTCNKAVN